MENNEKLIKQLEEKFFLLKRSTFFYFSGGFLAAIVSIFGISFNSMNNKIEDFVNKEVSRKIDAKSQQADKLLFKLHKIDSIGNTDKLFENLPVGTIIGFSGDNIPKGWLLCDGAKVNQKQYNELYNAIGTIWGSGDGNPGSFNLPDFRGIFLRGKDFGAGNDPDAKYRKSRTVGGRTGDNVGSYQSQATALPLNSFITDNGGQHMHSQYKVFHGQNLAFGDFLYAGNQTTDQQLGYNSSSGSHNHRINSGGDNETRPQNAYVIWIIKI